MASFLTARAACGCEASIQTDVKPPKLAEINLCERCTAEHAEAYQTRIQADADDGGGEESAE